MAPYIVGLGLGYFMYYCKNVRLSVFTLAAGWGLCFATLYAVIFGAFNLVQFDHKYDALEAALYASLHRVSWAIAVAWLIFACNNGYGGKKMCHYGANVIESVWETLVLSFKLNLIHV